MKVLMINVVCGIKSTGRICTDLAYELEKQGHEVKIAYGRENVPEKFQKYAIRIGNDFSIKIHGIKARVFDAAGFGSRKSTLKFIEWVKIYNPDVIHLHNIHGYYINVEVLSEYLKICGKRIIWTLHDCWAFTGHTAYCDSIGCHEWEKGCKKCLLTKVYPTSFIDNAYNNWKKKKKCFTEIPNMIIITPSEWLSGWVKKSFLKEYQVKVINNGIDTQQFYSRKTDFKERHGLTNKFMLLGVATSWNDMKGYSDFLKLSTILDEDCKLVLVGLSKQQMRTLPNNILGIEKTSSVGELAEIYSAADLFVNLSYCENYPTVNLEAILCGTQIVTYDVGGSPEIVRKVNGMIANRGDIYMVAELIKSYRINNNQLINVISQKLDVKQACYKYLTLYNNKED